MQYSMFINNAVEVVGGLLFLLTAIYILRDKLKVDRYIAGTLKIVLSKHSAFCLHLLLLLNFSIFV